MNDSEVETLGVLIVADTAFVEHSLVLKHISLAGLALAAVVVTGGLRELNEVGGPGQWRR